MYMPLHTRNYRKYSYDSGVVYQGSEIDRNLLYIHLHACISLHPNNWIKEIITCIYRYTNSIVKVFFITVVMVRT